MRTVRREPIGRKVILISPVIKKTVILRRERMDGYMRTAIVTDSNSGIFEKEGRKLEIHVVPMPVIIEGKTYYGGIYLSHEEFYQCLLEHREVSSSQPSPGDVMRAALQKKLKRYWNVPPMSRLSMWGWRHWNT